MLCPGNDGMKFVGLSEETFLDHIRNKHGDKVARRRPEKLRRECRICCDHFGTDAELGAHITSQHTNNKSLPFAGCGPKDDNSGESDDDDIFMERSVKRKAGPRRSPPASPSIPPPPPVKLVKPASSHAARSSQDWQAETDRFLNQINLSRRSISRRKNEDYNSSDDEDQGQASSYLPHKRPRLESSERCALCDEIHSDMPRHLARSHRKVCFSVPGNDKMAWLRLKEAVDYLVSSKGANIMKKDVHELLSERHIYPPTSIECIYCLYCSPPNMIVTDSIDSGDLRTKMFDHMERHEDRHKGDERIFIRHISWGCRLCEKSFISEEEQEGHINRHKRNASFRRSLTPRSAGKRRRSHEEGEVSPSPRSAKPTSSGDSSERQRMPPPPRVHSKDPRRSSSSSLVMEPGPREKFQCRMCSVQYEELAHLTKHLIREHKVYNDTASLMALSVLPSDLRKVSCKYCSTSWTGDPGKAVLRQHRESHPTVHTSINDCYQRECRACPQTFTFAEVSLWNTHMTSAHSSGSPPQKAPPNSVVSDQVQCSYCYDNFNHADLKRHMEKMHVSQSFQCGNCPAIFSTYAKSVRHMDYEHQVPARKAETLIVRPSDLRGIICQKCKWTMYQTGGSDMEEVMEFHYHIKHGISFENGQIMDSRMLQYFCRVCGKDKAYRNLKSLEEHVKEHIQQRKPSAFINSINKHLSSRAFDVIRDQSRDRSDRRPERAEDRRRNGSGDEGRREDRRDRRDSRGGRGWDGGYRDSSGGGRDETRGGARDSFRGGRDDTRGGQRDSGRGGEDWKCPKCSFDNFATRIACKRCGEPGGNGGSRNDFRGRGSRGGGRVGGRGRGYGGDRGRGRGRGGFRQDHGPRPEDWDCPGCKVLNFGNRTDCFRCGLGKNDKPQPKGPSAKDEYRDQIAAMFAQHQQDLLQQEQENQINDSLIMEAYDAVDKIFDVLVDEVFKVVVNEEEEELVGEVLNKNQNGTRGINSLNIEFPESETDQETPTDGVIKDAEALAEEATIEEAREAFVLAPPMYPEVPKTADYDNPGSNSDDDYAPDSPDYTAPMEEDAKPDFAALKAAEAALKEGVDLDLQEEGSEVTSECKLCNFQSKVVFDVYMHLEEEHDKNDCEEGVLRSLVRTIIPMEEKLPEIQPLVQETEDLSASHQKNNSTVEIESSVDVTLSKDVTMDDSHSGHTSEDTDRSASPHITTVDTVESLKEMLAMDGMCKFIVTPELQNTEEYKQFMDEYNKENEEN